MTNINLKYEILRNDELGRYLVAKKNIKQGELILTEKPLFISPNRESDLLCLNCYRDSKQFCK